MLSVPWFRRWTGQGGCIQLPGIIRNFSNQSDGVTYRKQDNAVDVSAFTPDRIRNFSIIAHVDSGKTTLSQRFLQACGSVAANQSQLFLDQLEVERERGITVHATTTSFLYTSESTDPRFAGRTFLMNLVDTPGHVDFQYEVSRALKACEGAILLVDATKGVQAGTISNFWLAFEQGLDIVPVINKIDLDHADPARCKEQLKQTFGIDPAESLLVSAKADLNVLAVLEAVIERIPPPSTGNGELRGLLYDSWYDRHNGAVMVWRMFSGSIKAGDSIMSFHSRKKYLVTDVGPFFPKPIKGTQLSCGQLGWVVCGLKTLSECKIGDSFLGVDKEDAFLQDQGLQLLAKQFQPTRSVVFAGLFTADANETGLLADAMDKILLTDNSVVARKESSLALGTGYRCGFYGVLHMEVFMQRLEQEYGLSVIATSPTVPYRVTVGKEVSILNNPAEFPDLVDLVEEPMVVTTIVAPLEYTGSIIQLAVARRGTQITNEPLGDSVVLKYRMPLAETITGFFDELKGETSGYASFEYEPAGYDKADVARVDVLLNGKRADPLTTLVHRGGARDWGVRFTAKLRDVIPRQLFEVVIQAAIGSKILCRERIAPLRKNVTAKCYGGDVTRKRKLLDKQKEGKKKMRAIGNVEISQEAFFAVLSTK